MQIDQPLQQVLSHCLIYEIPVPMGALEAVCNSIPNYQQQLKRGLALGLIEISSEVQEEDRVYRVSRILSHIILSIQLPDPPEVYSLYAKAQDTLHQLWGNKENENEERWREIFRLAFADKGNPERFREQFTKMISVQYNSEADSAYEKELRKHKEYLIETQGQIYQKLEEYLKQQDWKKADYETALIMYQWMVIENYGNFYDLFRQVSLDVIEDLDRLWMKYSEGKFGIKGQAKIYRDLGGTDKDYNEKIWDRFGDRVGWKQGEQWLELDEVAYRTTETHNYHLPVLLYSRSLVLGTVPGGTWWWGGGVGWRRLCVWFVSSLASRLRRGV